MGAQDKNKTITPELTDEGLSPEQLVEKYKGNYAELKEKYDLIVIDLSDTLAAKQQLANLLQEKEVIIVEITGKNVVLSTDLTNALAKYDAVVAHNNELIKANVSLRETQQIQEGLIKELQQELTAQENSTLIIQDVPTVKHEGEVYEIHARSFRLDGTDHTIESLKDPVIVGRLLEKKVGFLVKK
jgi:hypothetical protein